MLVFRLVFVLFPLFYNIKNLHKSQKSIWQNDRNAINCKAIKNKQNATYQISNSDINEVVFYQKTQNHKKGSRITNQINHIFIVFGVYLSEIFTLEEAKNEAKIPKITIVPKTIKMFIHLISTGYGREGLIIIH